MLLCVVQLNILIYVEMTSFDISYINNDNYFVFNDNKEYNVWVCVLYSYRIIPCLFFFILMRFRDASN